MLTQRKQQDAERVLAGKPNGTYIVRQSVSAPGDYVLSISVDGGVQHLQVGLPFVEVYIVDKDPAVEAQSGPHDHSQRP